MAEYTPPEAQVRQVYANSMDPAGFDRWLAEVRREAAEKAWDECSRTVQLRDFEAVCDPNPYRKDQP